MIPNVIPIHGRPRTAAQYEEPPDALVPALTWLRQCRDAWDVLVLLNADKIPDNILPWVAWAASRKPYIKHDVTQGVVTWCGPDFLERCLGKRRARELLRRYPKRAALSGL
jgi:hypothetical protein